MGFDLSAIQSCLISPECKNILEDLQHIIKTCPALQPTRLKLSEFTKEYTEKKIDNEEVRKLILSMTTLTHPQYMDYLLDCSCLPPVVSLVQRLGVEEVLPHLFTISGTWLFVLHRERLKLLGRWNVRSFSWKWEWRRLGINYSVKLQPNQMEARARDFTVIWTLESEHKLWP